jgi:hypothetical protein
MKIIFKLIAIMMAFAGFALAAEAPQPAKIPTIGYVSTNGNPSNPPPFVEAFRLG